ncbi:MAG TPA: 50S ribosomal protein L25/general stress protein Ctc, partial [Woeseiaceae bacterium]
MKQEFNLIAEFRDDQGKGASRRLRREGKVPAILYGAGREPRLLAFEHSKVMHQLQNESFYSSILTIMVGDKTQDVIVKDIQRHPAKPQILHMDFQRIVADQKIRMNVPLHFIGEDVAIGVKVGGGKVSHLMTDVEVTCLPKDLPEYFEVDVSGLDIDDMLYLSDIKVPAGVEIIEL